jgi:hypothetical protein
LVCECLDFHMKQMSIIDRSWFIVV